MNGQQYLTSEMSFVGPRPEAPKYVSLYTEEQQKVLGVKPGITDPATITYNNEAQLLYNTDDSEDTYIKKIMPSKLILNSEYIETQTLITDVKIIFKTILLILKFWNPYTALTNNEYQSFAY